jgi:hypothetical protein
MMNAQLAPLDIWATSALSRLKVDRSVPKVPFCDNGSEFTSQAMDLSA